LTDSQRENLAKKLCQACNRDIPPRSKKCSYPDCGAEQQLKTDVEMAELMQPIEPYTGSGQLPRVQNSTQALANVTKRVLHPQLLKQVSSTPCATVCGTYKAANDSSWVAMRIASMIVSHQ